ncbi:hypothetical protein CVT24_009945 [Panaeolus cyanescens]|uniref:HAM1-like N-terminal domain-containing protein n=1 Tax=Panaeolus cyanescens TaxID=181874 RepID=A0A409VXN4_9AGAR|nr:hypothetical protein CVT24_009945 [Panaeolus cyanescens]
MDCWTFCFGKSREHDDERRPLIPKHQNGSSRQPTTGRNGPNSALPLETTALDKVIDAITAFKAGKLPSQTQIEHALRGLLNSEFLQEEGGPTMAGNGPFSKEGRKVLGDVRELVQAVLEFGLEKNADDKIQDTYFQLLHLSSEFSQDVSSHKLASGRKRGPKEDTPLSQQIAFDAQTFIHAIRTLLGTTLTSAAFRVLILDILAIINELMESVAKDVKSAAGRVQKVAEDIENQAKGDHDVIDEIVSKGATSTNDLKEKGKAIVETAQTAAKDLGHELGTQAQESTGDAKERLLSRIRQVLSRLQKDPSSRAAIQSLLILFQKYTTNIGDISGESKSSAKQTSSEITGALEDATRSTYPPDPYGQHSQRKIPAYTPSDLLFANLKELLERLGQKHSLDPLLAALRNVVVDLQEDVPKAIQAELTETIQQHADEEIQDKATSTPTPTPTPAQTQLSVSEQPVPKGKSWSRKAARKARKRSQKLERAEVTPISPSESQGATPSESQSRNLSPSADDSSKEPNVVRLYFNRLGEYLSKSMHEPHWAASQDGAKSLESLFDDGVQLVNIVGESIVEVEDKVTTTAPSSDNEQSQGTSTTDDDEKGHHASVDDNERIRRKFKADLQNLVKELEDFVDAIQADRTTLKVWRAWQALEEDGQALVAVGGKRAYNYMHNLSPWTEWIGWAVPRILKILPLSAIPIPTVEFKNPSLEGALHGLFVQGLARGKENVAQGSLIPDELVVTEFTEFRLNMVDRPLHSSMPMAEVPAGTLHKPNFNTVARLHLHANGIRAKIDKVGYYFKYIGTILGYEDQGVLSADLAVDSPHQGFRIDIELETDVSKTAQADSSPVPEIVVEGEDGMPQKGVHLSQSRPML